ncbi:hypothetical protein PHLGIDRAFT_134042 [Phlebiopsis gigantea 11061_1 CR5-6]|uniref:F-box domain-containing protein n=1 Tax=Phlebiopsis gigantea (strain 11061_1 CR5-6) TaxID=745531 RepID=A0A0C3P443_PHLG1|nr:hypothetical protein PHLGIDRAFT_134042 [Phlebiopsis gigantea 11061_1 CR5-6]
MPHRGALQTIDAQLESLAAQETQHRDGLRRIQQRRELLIAQRTMIERRRTIYSLPTEVLLHVFHFFVQWDEDDWQEGDEIDWRAMALSHVCSTWRAAVLNTSSLWACLDFSRYPAVRPMIARSKEQPVDVVHGIKPLPGYKHDIRFETVLRSTAPRWRSLLWESTELRMTDVLFVLNSGTSFPRLRGLELGIEKRTLPGVPLSPQSALHPGKSSLFPRLERICLSSISLSELPPTDLPCLRSLTLHFPSKYPSTRANLFRMSSLHTFLSRTPQLESLVFSDSTPLMDVFVRTDPKHTVDGSDPPFALPSNQIVPLTLPYLRRFEWSHAPPRDLWRLFAMINMPALKELEVYLDPGERRWYTFYASILEPMGDEPFSPRLLHPVVRLDQLEDLAVFATDVDGLCTAFRSMEFPKLKKLTLGNLVQRAIKVSKAVSGKPVVATPILPSQEAIFREPRMAELTHLTLSQFRLDRTSISTMLAYMQGLQNLTVESCRGM